MFCCSAATASQNGDEANAEAADALDEPEQQPEQPEQSEPAADNGDFDYVPMSEWGDELETSR